MPRITFRICSIIICFIILSGCASKPKTDPNAPSVAPPVFNTEPLLITIDTVPDVYYVENHINMFFYVNLWYYYCDNKWFISSSYNGPWIYIETYRLPGRLGQIPSGHLRQPPSYPKETPSHNKKDK
ncbi:MAG: hypothetical protein V1709_02625 [Planctomycetota bacterium]